MRFLQGSSGFFKGFLDTPAWVGLVLSPVLAGVLVPPALSLTWAGAGVEWRGQLVAQAPANPEATRANADQLMQEAEELFNQQTVETRQQALAKLEQTSLKTNLIWYPENRLVPQKCSTTLVKSSKLT